MISDRNRPLEFLLWTKPGRDRCPRPEQGQNLVARREEFVRGHVAQVSGRAIDAAQLFEVGRNFCHDTGPKSCSQLT